MAVLTRVGIPSDIMAVIHRFHDGTQARVRMDDEELSEWFEVIQALRRR